MTQHTAENQTPNVLAANGKPKILGFVCEWSIGRNDVLEEDGTVRGAPHIKTIKIPCSGFVKTEWVTLAFENGAQGVFVLGCPLGDCHFNEGNFIINDRLSQHVGRLVGRKNIDDAGRVAELYLSASHDQDFVQQLGDFTNYIEALPPLAAPVKKGAKKAAAPVAAPAAAKPAAEAPAAPVSSPAPVAVVETPAPVAPAVVAAPVAPPAPAVEAPPAKPIVTPMVDTSKPAVIEVVAETAPAPAAAPATPAAPASDTPRSSKIKRWNPNKDG